MLLHASIIKQVILSLKINENLYRIMASNMKSSLFNTIIVICICFASIYFALKLYLIVNLTIENKHFFCNICTHFDISNLM